jgi:hypothetical protein
LNHFIFQFCKAYWVTWLSLWGNFGTHLSVGGSFGSPPHFKNFDNKVLMSLKRM